MIPPIDIDVNTPWWVWALVTAGAGTIAWVIRVVVKLIVQPTQQIIKGDMVPRITVDMMIRHYDERNDDLITQYEARLAAKDTELDKLWTAYHLEASANQAVARGEMEQANAAAQSVMALMESLHRARSTATPEVASSDNGAAHPGPQRSIERAER